MRDFLFTSESVTGGHPDKVADQISDAVLDEILRKDPRGGGACATMGGAGAQGLMFGCACRETKEWMPMPSAFAHRICGRLTEAREKRVLPWLRPDGKSQGTVRYAGGGPGEGTAGGCSR